MAHLNEITTPSQYEVLREVVKDYPGILSTVDSLMKALKSDPKDWDVIVRETRAYALKNFYLHDHHDKSIEVIRAIIDILMEAIRTSETRILQQVAVDSLMFYLKKILLDSDQDLNKYALIFEDCFDRLNLLQEEQFFSLIASPHQLKKLGQIIWKNSSMQSSFNSLNTLIEKSILTTYTYWLNEENPSQWLRPVTDKTNDQALYGEIEKVLYPISHARYKDLIANVKNISNITDNRDLLEEQLKLPGYMDVVKTYEDISGMLPKTGDVQTDLHLKVTYLLKVMQTQGLASIHENTLRELNRTLAASIRTEDHIKIILTDILSIMNSLFPTYPEVTLYCIQGIGNEIYNRGDSDLVAWYIHNIISLGFQYPQIAGATDEWQVKSNRAHIKNIRVWLELIENNPKWSRSLISALILHLSLGGVHISDTDLFQKDITKLLNSDIEPVYCQIKQLAQLFPVYFFDIGAEGELREVSTQIDEITGRRDHIIHFIRKQSHVESSAHVVEFMEEIIRFWKTKDKAPLKGFLPEDVYEHTVPSGPYVDEINMIFTALFTKKEIRRVTDLLNINEDYVTTIMNDISGISERELERARLAIRFYQLLNQKYHFNILDIKNNLKQAHSLGLPNTDTLIHTIEYGTVCERLQTTLEYLKRLREVILSPEHYEPVENIFRKRHISAGIPSMYGNYHERKFDALTFTFRLEHYANILFEDIVNSFHPKYITRATLVKINTIMHLFSDALQQDGIESEKLDAALELLSGALDVRRFSFSQYIDIFKSFSESVQSIVNTHFADLHKSNLKHIIHTIGNDNILPQYRKCIRSHDDAEFLNKVSEQFLRDIVASSFGLQQLDNFISNILKTLREQEKESDVDNLSLLMSYDSKKTLCSILNPDQSLYNRIYLGNKGYNLLRMSSLGLPVPPGFIITTEVFRCLNAINRFQYAKDHLARKIKEHMTDLEDTTGKELGNPENPLLVSVRSGGALSMPGMMNSFLNVGINESIVQGLIAQTGNPWFAWDCYRRFLQFWGMSFGIERDTFDSIIDAFKKQYALSRKSQFTSDQMKEIAFAYRKAIDDLGIKIVDDPESQLNTVIAQVFASWFSQKAQKYRDIMGLSEHWGTAVIVQAMAYGNFDHNAGSGVIFTRNPHESNDSMMLWGDFAVANQGDDIVSGLVRTLPVSNEQRATEGRITDNSLQDSFPEIYNELHRFAYELIYRQRWSAQEIEFTFEGIKKHNLYMLQSRDMNITEQESLDAFVPTQELSEQYLSSGIGVGGGALSGIAVFNLSEIQEFREKDPSLPLILIRSDTVPDDIVLISSADGLLTARGGSTSHAAIIANRLGKTCVVGCNYLVVRELEKSCMINNQTIKTGNYLSIDGRSGSVYSGKHLVQEITIVE